MFRSSHAVAFLRRSLTFSFKNYALTLMISTAATLCLLTALFTEDSLSAEILSVALITFGISLPLAFALDSFTLKAHLTFPDFSRGGAWVGRCLVVIGSAALYFSLKSLKPEVYSSNVSLIVLCAHLFCAFAPFVRNRDKDDELWEWNMGLLSRFIQSMIYSFVLYVGLSLAILTTVFLFHLELSKHLYNATAILCLCLFHTFFFVSSMNGFVAGPGENRDSSLPAGQEKFFHWILLPLQTFFLFILLCYWLKVVFSAEAPLGGLAPLLMICATSGLLFWLILWPDRSETTDVPKIGPLYRRYFLLSLIPLMTLLAYLQFVRLKAYGMTEPRYLLVLATLWMFGIIISYGPRKKRRLFYMPMSLCALLLVASFGPFSMASVSKRWQIARLQHGWAVASVNPDQANGVSSVSSAMNYLKNKHPDDLRGVLVELGVSSEEARDLPARIIQSRGWKIPRESTSQAKEIGTKSYLVELDSAMLTIHQGLRVKPFFLSTPSGVGEVLREKTADAQWELAGDRILLKWKDRDEKVEFPISSVLNQSFEGRGLNMIRQSHELLIDGVSENQQRQYKILLQKITWSQTGGISKVVSVNGMLYEFEGQ